MAVDDDQKLVFRSLKGRYRGNQFLGEIDQFTHLT